MIQGEDKGQAGTSWRTTSARPGEISPTIDSTWSIKLPE